jgi:hypothetical protein
MVFELQRNQSTTQSNVSMKNTVVSKKQEVIELLEQGELRELFDTCNYREIKVFSNYYHI